MAGSPCDLLCHWARVSQTNQHSSYGSYKDKASTFLQTTLSLYLRNLQLHRQSFYGQNAGTDLKPYKVLIFFSLFYIWFSEHLFSDICFSGQTFCLQSSLFTIFGGFGASPSKCLNFAFSCMVLVLAKQNACLHLWFDQLPNASCQNFVAAN